MDVKYTITLARPEHIASLPGIERAAASLLVGRVPPAILEETTELDELRRAQEARRLWVALVDGTPVGFAYVSLLPSGAAHLQEIDVLPEHGRQGLGAALLRAVLTGSGEAGHSSITLTTFRHLPWNMPFYARHGFLEVASEFLTDELRAIVAAEAARGLSAERRVVMRCDLARTT